MNLNEIEYKEKELKHLKKQEQRRLSREFRKENNKWFLMLDLLMIFVFVHNSAAIMITNVLVVKESVEAEKKMTFYEANPVQQKIGDYSQAPTIEQEKSHRRSFNQVIVVCLEWAVMVTLYIFLRNSTYNMARMCSLVLLVMFWFIATHWDFLNDLGYLIGKWKYG